jgi:putative transposase
MRCLNEFAARKANQKDRCSGRCWEGCFNSQALRDENTGSQSGLSGIEPGTRKNGSNTGILGVHLNRRTYRCGKTSGGGNQPLKDEDELAHLLLFVGNPWKEMPEGLPFRFTSYLELVDWTGRILAEYSFRLVSRKAARDAPYLAC